MKTENAKKSMKATSLWKSALIVAVLLVFLFPILSEAATLGKTSPQLGHQCMKVNIRPISDLLKTQGTTANFFPPFPDYLGWADGYFPNFTYFALVDYAGLANNYIKKNGGHSLGTEVKGTVIECVYSDHTQVTVTLATTKALGFAQSNEDLSKTNYDFANTPTIFGHKAYDVLFNKAEPALGPVAFLVSFSMPGPNMPLPNLLDVVTDQSQYAPVKVSFTSTTLGKRADGTKAALYVHQVGESDAKNNNTMVFPIQDVKILDAQ